MRQEKAKEEKKRKSGKILKLKMLSGHAQTWQKLIFCIWYEGCKVYNLLTAFLVFNKLLINEAEYLMKNYGDWGGCFSKVDNTLQELHNSSYDMKAEFNNNFILLFIQNNS